MRQIKMPNMFRSGEIMADLELGQMIFSNNDWYSYDADWATDGLVMIAQVIAELRGEDPDGGWTTLTSNSGGEEFVNDVFEMRHEYDKSIGAEIIDFYKNDYIIGTNNKRFPIPAVAKTAKYFRINNHTVKFSRKNLFVRDNYTCQYCDTIFNGNDLTYDHVIPKSAWKSNIGSPTCWTNIVTACVNCNRKKGNRTKMIIWARFTHDVEQISKLCERKEIKYEIGRAHV